MTVAQAEAAELGLRAEVVAMETLFRAEVKAWIAGECDGPQPTPDIEAFQALADRLRAAVNMRVAIETGLIPAALDGGAGLVESVRESHSGSVF